MSNLNLRINLTKVGDFVQLKDGSTAILIKSDAPGIYVGKEGVYLNAVCLESSAKFASHLVKIDKGEIIGNLVEFQTKQISPKKVDL